MADQRFIRDAVFHYPRRDQVATDVIAALDYYTTLHPEKSDFNYDDGRVELLLGVHGVLPVSLRGHVYNCPLALWLPLDYPAKPPIVLVQPTNTMQIKPSSHVDRNGKVTVPYMKDWDKKGEGFSLMPLIEVLVTLFGRDYPLVSIPAGPPKPNPPPPPPAQASPTPANPAPPPRPPPPATAYYRPPPPSGHDRSDSGDSANHPAPPPRPPLPPTNGGQSSTPSYVKFSTHPSVGHGQPQPPTYQSSPPNPPPARQMTYSPSGPPLPRPPAPPAPPGPYQTPQPAPPSSSMAPAPPAHYAQPPPLPAQPSQTLHSQYTRSPQPPPPPPVQQQQQQPPPPPPGHFTQPPLPVHHQPPQQQTAYAPSRPLPLPASTFGHQYSSAATDQRPQSPLRYAAHPQRSLPVQPGHPHSQFYPPAAPHPHQEPSMLPPPSSRLAPSSVPAVAPPPRAKQLRVQALNILDGPDDDSTPSTPINQQPQLSRSVPPPLPPNPELLAIRTRIHSKLSHHLASLASTTEAELARMALLTADLEKGEPAIVDEMQRLEAVRDVCRTVRDRYREVVGAGEARLAEYEARGDGPEVDEIVCSSTVVYNQLLELVAEDAALEDTIYHLGRALNSESANIDLDRFLKRVRGLAREQFLKRALINKSLIALASRQAQRS